MKVIHKVILLPILKTALVTLLLCTLMMESVQLFSDLDNYLNNHTSLLTILQLCLLDLPTSMLYCMAPSLLFASAFTFSQLTANNELICLYNASFSQKKIVLPVLLMGLFFCMFQFAANEFLAIPAMKERNMIEAQNFGLKSTRDNRNITLTDYDNALVFHAKFYNDQVKQVSNVSILLKGQDGLINERIDAPEAFWDEKQGLWVFFDVTLTDIDIARNTISIHHMDSYSDRRLDLKPQLLRDNSDDIKTMELSMALPFLQTMKKLDRSKYQEYAVDFAQRILGCLAPVVMLFISCTINYKFKKNILLFTIILSLCIAVIYFVVQMMTLILARQGVLNPVQGMVIPMIVIVCISGLERLLFR